MRARTASSSARRGPASSRPLSAAAPATLGVDDATVVRWWRDEGGRVVTFGSDAHEPDELGLRLGAAVDMVESFGFRPGRHPYDRWTLPG